VHDLAAGGGPHRIEGLAPGIAADGADIDAFMQLDEGDLLAGALGSAHKSELSALPGVRFFTLEIPLDEHEEILRAAFEQGAVFGRKIKEGCGAQAGEGAEQETETSWPPHCGGLGVDSALGVGLGLGAAF